MKKNQLVKVALIILMILFAVGIVNNMFPSQSAIAAGKIQYKVVSAEKIYTAEGYESLLNEMSNKGWTFDHAFLNLYVTFRK
ncbi:hypothetical protein H8E88_34425 [candidate division KSB1 bacterium]|nr:hypothetical protein [candidate division KSB1 bacterium]